MCQYWTMKNVEGIPQQDTKIFVYLHELTLIKNDVTEECSSDRLATIDANQMFFYVLLKHTQKYYSKFGDSTLYIKIKFKLSEAYVLLYEQEEIYSDFNFLWARTNLERSVTRFAECGTVSYYYLQKIWNKECGVKIISIESDHKILSEKWRQNYVFFV